MMTYPRGLRGWTATPVEAFIVREFKSHRHLQIKYKVAKLVDAQGVSRLNCY